jgi:transposase-like protein
MGRTTAAASGNSENGEPRDTATKLARQRMSVLELAAELGNAAEACRRRGMDRTSFYEWKRQFQTHGFAGLKDLAPIHRSHPQTTPAETVARIEELALAHPAYGCNRIEALLALEGRRVSAITVQKILNDRGLGSRHDRWLALERRNAEHAIELTGEQVAFLEKLNAYASEHHLYLSQSGGTTVSGSPGKDLLVGGHAATLAGDAGDDAYHIAHADAKITETATGGIDTVYASVSYTLPSCVENGIAYMRGGGITLIGNELDNKLISDLTADTIYGREGNDVTLGLGNKDKLYGEAGNDTINGCEDDDVINGGDGSDSLTGGTGADRFVFLPGESGIDVITDFLGTAGDKIDLSAFVTGSAVT